MSSRFFLHPILENYRSRIIFAIFFVIAFAIGLGYGSQVNATLQLAGLRETDPFFQDNHMARVLMSNLFRFSLVFLVTVIATALTARKIVGPIKRIEQWLSDWNDNLNPFPLLVRKNDKFSRLVELLNHLYQASNRPPSG